RVCAMMLAGALAGLAACDRGAPLEPGGDRALPPDEASWQVHPACTGTGGTTHAATTITTAVTWAASGNPHRVTDVVSLSPGGTLTLQPGVVVCFSPQTLLQSSGGRLVAQGTTASRIVLTAADPALGWQGVNLSNVPVSTSLLKHVTIEYTARGSAGVYSYLHPVAIDSTIIRQSGRGVDLEGGGSSFARSRVDTTTYRSYLPGTMLAAVKLKEGTRFEQSVIRGAAEIGMWIDGSDIQILGGRIEGSAGVGIYAAQSNGIPWATPLRVVGGGSYPIEASIQMLRSLYTLSNHQDSLKGNARDTVLMHGGDLWQSVRVRAGLPWRVIHSIRVSQTGAHLAGEPGSLLVLNPGVGITAHSGGRVVLRGSHTNPVVLTAADPALGWNGITLEGSPTDSSYITNTRVEHVAHGNTALVAQGAHRVAVDSAVFRQNGSAVSLLSAGSRLSRSRVDTTTNRDSAAVTLEDNTTFEQSVIRRAAGVGLRIKGDAGVHMKGGRIEGSGDVGIHAPHATTFASVSPVRVVGGGSYGIKTDINVLQRLYGGALSYQDSLKGNARDTVWVLGGTLTGPLFVRAGLPWHVQFTIAVGAGGGTLRGEAGSLMVIERLAAIHVHSGGRVNLRGTKLNPVVVTADDPALGWEGILLEGTPTVESYITNTRVEHVRLDSTAVVARPGHKVVIDSAVFRRNGRAVSLLSAGSRLSRTRVDTTLSASGPAVELGGDAILESTRIRGSSQDGVAIRASTVQVLSCEVVGSVGDGIVLDASAPVSSCNLVSNGGVGVRNNTSSVAVVSNNWWGDATGPFGPNGDGLWGTANYTPFLTAPFVLPYVP
ncbi:MAG TPA: right-handed parallel beta-helix repeat-containing protein, partial [Longimicrobium sp.]|nr:right-handed parallel beta-helix repeat-containing protein [Longimicrobium sp.]